jgi:hypothetical protein
MKKCTYCGKEYPDETLVCEIDQSPLRPVEPPFFAGSTPLPAGDAQQIIDNEHLKMLSIFHYVFAGLALLGLLFLCFHFLIMATVMYTPGIWQTPKNQSAPPADILVPIFAVFYTIFGGIFAAAGILNFLSARFLRHRRHRTFSLVAAGLNCLQIPFGTVLGVFTIMVLSRPSVREKYGS